VNLNVGVAYLTWWAVRYATKWRERYVSTVSMRGVNVGSVGKREEGRGKREEGRGRIKVLG
jgi:hypothetical protein